MGGVTPPSFVKYVEKFGPESWLERRKSVRLKSEKVNILCVEKEKSPSTLRIVHTQLHKPRYKTYFAAANSLIKSIKFRVTTGLANYNVMRPAPCGAIKRALFIVKLAAHCLICSTNYLRLLANSNNIRKHDASIQWILKLFSCVLDYFL